MSTPSTITATIPPSHHLHHYGFTQPHNSYSNTSRRLPDPTSVSRSSGLASSYTFPNNTPSSLPRHTSSTSMQPRSAAMHPSQSDSRLSKSTAMKQERKPDWTEFYKNGVPKEIIQIDSDSDDQATMQGNGSSTRGGGRQAQPAAKKRKTALISAHEDPEQQAQYSQNHSSASHTASTDRTTSLQTTAPTSLGSNASHGSSRTMTVAELPTPAAGQKRKRVTRKSAADDLKKQENSGAPDALSHYFPPPRPPVKAPEVHVAVLRDTKTMHENVDDEDGHFEVKTGGTLGDRYDIRKLLGQGTFGKVVEAYDRRNKSRCAIKIIRSVQKYRDASRIELRVLNTLKYNDRENRNKCIHLRETFDFRNHICIVTDLLGQSVFDFLKGNQFTPFPSSQIQSFAKQLFTSVAFLHDLQLVHTDLKPENILLVNNTYQTFTYNRYIPSSTTLTQRNAKNRKVLLDTDIRLIDFGSATFDTEYHSTVVSTRHYRAPEIILNLGWSFPCDIWSIGCILVEFYTGDALFQTHDNLEHLAMMEPVCGGKIETRIVRQVQQAGRGSSANSAAKHFTRGGKLDYPNSDTAKASKRFVKGMKKLDDIIPPHTAFNKQFLDLLRKIFVYDPKRRVDAKDALRHPWFREGITDDGTEALRLRREEEERLRRIEREGRGNAETGQSSKRQRTDHHGTGYATTTTR